MQFIVKRIKNDDIKAELNSIGFDSAYLENAAKKHKFLTLKIQNLPYYSATIIKETALSKGCDAGVNRNVLTQKVESSDLILSGTIKQLEEVSKSLLNQPFGLKFVAEKIQEEILISNKTYSPKIMGILNLSNDSFSDGGKYSSFKEGMIHVEKMLENGANIIDIGAEATNWNSSPIDPVTEIEKITPFIKEIKKLNAKISIDTRHSKTAKKAVELGADIINDVSGLNFDPEMINIIKNSNTDYILCHSKGTPDTMDSMADYNNISDEIFKELKEKIELIGDKERIIADVGFGFAKNAEQNFELLKRIQEFNSLGVKTLAGVSRKRFLKTLIKNENEIDDITSLASFYLFENKVDIIRVHNVAKTKLALDFYNSIN